MDSSTGAVGAPDTGEVVAAAASASRLVPLAGELLRLQGQLRECQAGLENGAVPALAVASGEPAATEPAELAELPQLRRLQGVADQLNRQMREALAGRAFFYQYQPIVSPVDGALAGHEALLRWRRGGRSVPPMSFLPVVEECGILAEIQDYLLADVAALLARSTAPATVSINWSPAQFCDVRAARDFLQRAAQLGIDATRLVIEITERSLLVSPERALLSITLLKSHGVQIALDDFGRGYCGFAYLRDLPIDLIKVDGSLVHGLGQSRRSVVILEAIVELAHRLGHRVVAEGVESEAQLLAARRSGCDLVQGYLIGRPATEPTQPCKVESFWFASP